MKNCAERDAIDNKLVTEIEKTLVSFGVSEEKAFAAYAAIRFHAEARGVLLNRVQDRKMSVAGINYYGQLLDEIAAGVGVIYDPDQPE